MTVTRIEELSRSRCKIYLEDSFAFVLYKGELRLYGVREQEELSEESYREIMQEVLPKRATLRCMNLLQSRAYTESKLRSKLKEGGYPQESIDSALAYVKSYHYVDDLRYAKTFIRYHQEKRSRRRLYNDLRQKGISTDVITRSLEEEFFSDERQQIMDLIEKKGFSADTADQKEYRKMYQFLMRRGFKGTDIMAVMRYSSQAYCEL